MPTDTSTDPTDPTLRTGSATTPRSHRLRRILMGGALVTGATLGAAGIAAAATSSTTTPTTGASGTTAPSGAPSGTPPTGGADPATLAHGPGETLLTGTELTQATTAAEAAVTGATVVRAETNSSGGYPYEVHLKKSDGTYATVELNSSFGVITTITGFGAGPAGGTAPSGSSAPGGGTPPSAPSGSSSTSTAA